MQCYVLVAVLSPPCVRSMKATLSMENVSLNTPQQLKKPQQKIKMIC